MKKYKYKNEVVEAGEIASIGQPTVDVVELKANGKNYHFNMAWTMKNKPETGGYLVKHEDGISFMSAATFKGLCKEI